MAEVNTGGGHDKGKGGKRKQKKINLRVDFTPMVDMNMLLITFFMFCTTLSKPQTMEITMPDDKGEPKQINDKLVVTILATANDRVFYYFGEPNYEDYTSLKETDYTAEGLRKVLLKRNASIVAKVSELKTKRINKEITEDEFKKQAAEAKGVKGAPIVIIKVANEASYKNVIDLLDEMLICSIDKYALVNYADSDDFLVKNLITGGHAAVGK